MNEDDLNGKIERLDYLSQFIFKLRFILDKTQKETSDILNIHPKIISRIEKRIINDLKKENK